MTLETLEPHTLDELELERLIAEYLETLDDVREDEAYGSERVFADDVLSGFLAWVKANDR